MFEKVPFLIDRYAAGTFGKVDVLEKISLKISM